MEFSMFTGIVLGLGRVDEKTQTGTEYRLGISANFDWGDPLVIGESIAVSGVCLTVTQTRDRWFSAFVSAETLGRTVLGGLRTGDPVNLERALRLSDRLGGHLVTGHVDGLGRIQSVQTRNQSLVVTVGVEPDVARRLIEKGSVAMDGVSLTVNQVSANGFSVNLIPHTADQTTLRFKKTGDYVNVETDLIGKYVARLLGQGPEGSKIDRGFLAEHGFL
jgi:riboflavin synthase